MRELFESTVERLFGDLVTPELIWSTQKGEWPAALWNAVEESGFSIASAPEQLGGTGSSWNDLYVVIRAAGRHALPLPLPEALLANWLLGKAGIDAVSGPLTFAAESTLIFEDGKATGQLLDVPWGRHAEHVVAVSSGTVPMVMLLRARDGSQASLRLNIAGEPRDDLKFVDAQPVAAAPLPRALGKDVLLLGGAMLRSAQIAGALQHVLEATSRYASERSQFGRPIAGFQAIQHQLAVLAEHAASAMIASEAAFAESEASLAALSVMSAKLCASEAAGSAASTAHAVHGAIGITHEHSLHFSTQRLWSWRSEFGSLTFWAQRIGREVCAGGATRFWPSLTSGTLQQATAITGDAQ